jgi:radical SAM protein with 4Fe4S-binding SPASM domain
MAIKHPFDFFVQWHLTEKCNLRCRHCYQSGKHSDEMALPEIKQGIHEMSDTLTAWKTSYDINFSPSVNISGGEPLLRKDLFEIITEFKEQEFEIYLLTNGTLVSREKAVKLQRSGVNGVQVSIEGTEVVHESIRGRKSFHSAIKGVKNLLDAGLDVTLNVTLSKVNAGNFRNMVLLSKGLGVQNLGFSRLVPSGRGEAMKEEMLSMSEVRDLYKKIFSSNMNGLKIVSGDPVASPLLNRNDTYKEGDVPVGGCAAGLSGLTILPDGTLLPCRRLPLPLGNVREDSIREVWASSEVLRALRDRSRYKGKCGSCRNWAHCRGCRAIAYAYSQGKGNGDMLAEDPQCFL